VRSLLLAEEGFSSVVMTSFQKNPFTISCSSPYRIAPKMNLKIHITVQLQSVEALCKQNNDIRKKRDTIKKN